MLQKFKMCNASTLCVQSANQFEMFSFIRSKHMAWAPKCRSGLHDPDHAHLGTVYHEDANTSRDKLVYKI